MLSAVAVVLSASAAAQAQEAADADALARQLSNPVASLISVPLQLNYDEGRGPGGDGERWLLNVQPVIPIDLNEDWNLISRTIVPLISQEDVFAGDRRQSGLGDIVQSLFFSPKEVSRAALAGFVVGFLILEACRRPARSA